MLKPMKNVYIYIFFFPGNSDVFLVFQSPFVVCFQEPVL